MDSVSFVEKWPLSDPNDVAFLLITYLLFVFKIGPFLMENRRPLLIKPLLIVYNGFNVVNSAILAYRFFSYMMDRGLFSKSCDMDDGTVYKIAVLYWKYMVTKVLYLFDTVFFILHKEHSQITFLHVFHRVFMVIVTWSSLKYDPSDHWAFMAMADCLMHIALFTFYGISAMGSKNVYWKKCVPVMLSIQFVVVSTHLVIQTYSSQCMHVGTYWVEVSNLFLLAILFADFCKKLLTLGAPDEIACSKQAE